MNVALFTNESPRLVTKVVFDKRESPRLVIKVLFDRSVSPLLYINESKLSVNEELENSVSALFII